jgi:hypothetical protein
MQRSNVKLFGVQGRRETAKPLPVLELMKAVFSCDGNTRQLSATVRCFRRNSLDPIKDSFLKLMMQSSRFFKIRKTGMKCVLLFSRHIQALYHFLQNSTLNGKM